MKIAITGASGFVGRQVVRAIAQRGDVEVVATSRHDFVDGLPSGVRHVTLDLAAPPADAFAILGKPDALIHLAWSGLPNYQSRHHFETELPRQYAFLRQLVESGLGTLLGVGTCLEYGMCAGELDESVPTDPQNPYGYAKDALRRQLQFLAVESGLRLTWARLFYMYGEGQAPSSLYSQFMAAGQSGTHEFSMSGGEQLRDYMDVREVARSVVELACRAPGAGIVNICAGRPTSVRNLVEGWIGERGWSMALSLGRYPYPTYEPMAFWGCNAKLSRLLEST